MTQNKYMLIITWFWRSGVSHGSHWTKIKVSAGLHSYLEAVGEPLSASRSSPPSSLNSPFLHLQSQQQQVDRPHGASSRQQQQVEASWDIPLTFFQGYISFGLSPASLFHFERPLGLHWSTGMIQGQLNSDVNFICNVNLPLPRDGTYSQAPRIGI